MGRMCITRPFLRTMCLSRRYPLQSKRSHSLSRLLGNSLKKTGTRSTSLAEHPPEQLSGSVRPLLSKQLFDQDPDGDGLIEPSRDHA